MTEKKSVTTNDSDKILQIRKFELSVENQKCNRVILVKMSVSCGRNRSHLK